MLFFSLANQKYLPGIVLTFNIKFTKSGRMIKQLIKFQDIKFVKGSGI